MGRVSVVIISSRTLFAEGVASRLRQYLGADEIMTVDGRAEGVLKQVIAARPDTVIVDATDTDLEQHCPLTALLNALPSLKVIRLDPQQEEVQVVTSQRRTAAQVADLIEVIRSLRDGQPGPGGRA